MRLALLQGEEQVELECYNVDKQPEYGNDEDDDEEENETIHQIIPSESAKCHHSSTKHVPELSSTDRLVLSADLSHVLTNWAETSS